MRTYGRSFAEFLNEESPVRLRLLDVPTCFGFSTDIDCLTLEAFLERWLGKIDPLRNLFSRLQFVIKDISPDLPRENLWRKNAKSITRSTYSSPSLHQNNR